MLATMDFLSLSARGLVMRKKAGNEGLLTLFLGVPSKEEILSCANFSSEQKEILGKQCDANDRATREKASHIVGKSLRKDLGLS